MESQSSHVIIPCPYLLPFSSFFPVPLRQSLKTHLAMARKTTQLIQEPPRTKGQIQIQVIQLSRNRLHGRSWSS
jgi:hypothetical protein